MKRRVKLIVDQVCEQLQTWDSVECVTFMEPMDKDYSDPYFFISMDVFYRGDLPAPEQRTQLLPEAVIFESSKLVHKDRFLMDEIPVRIEYKSSERLDDVLSNIENNSWAFRQTGTFMFYRLKYGQVMYSRSAWFDSVIKSVEKLPDGFWNMVISATQATMEHCLSDMGAAVLRDDSYFFLISSSGFLKSLCSMIFAINHELEPSERVIHDHILKLKELPASFRGLFTSFLSADAEFPMQRKQEVAQLLAKGTISLT